MPDIYDFEKTWQDKFSHCLDKIVGKEIRKQVMQGNESLTTQSSPQETINWIKTAMERLESMVSEEKRRQIMAGCACQYPLSNLQGMKKVYETTQDIDRVHQMLQEQFEDFLKHTLRLDENFIETIVAKGWGAAGIKKDNTIIATKIPKSDYLMAYMIETDPEKKRQYYCHCPRVRDALTTGDRVSATYCYCGAGFYKGIWEEITQKTVEVELLESVLQGDEICSFAIHLPSDT